VVEPHPLNGASLLRDVANGEAMIANPILWPNGARCAVAVTWDMDADSVDSLSAPSQGNIEMPARKWFALTCRGIL
jgi:hypothetical protein